MSQELRIAPLLKEIGDLPHRAQQQKGRRPEALPIAVRIVEIGSHEELITRNGTYARLFSLQAEGYR